jgi:hypothetical protein
VADRDVGMGATPQGSGADKAEEERTPGLRCRFLWARGRWSVLRSTRGPRGFTRSVTTFFNSVVRELNGWLCAPTACTLYGRSVLHVRYICILPY